MTSQRWGMLAARSARAAAVAALTETSPILASFSPLSSSPTECGQLMCSAHQYCQKATNMCADCSTICRPGDNNYQPDTCQSACQGYLHDMLYQTRTDDVNVAAAVSRLEGDLHRLTIMVSVMFCLFIVCFIGLAIYACSSYRKACRRRKTADLESNSIELKKIGAKLANGIGPPPPPPAAGPPLITPKSSTVPQYATDSRQSLTFTVKPGDEEKRVRTRHPSEDTCPGDYSAVYDNPAMVVTPPLAAGGATGHPLSAASTLRSRDSFRPAGSAASSMRTESTRVPREVDITDLSPARAVEAI